MLKGVKRARLSSKDANMPTVSPLILLKTKILRGFHEVTVT